MDSAQNPTASTGAPGSHPDQPATCTSEKTTARELRREFVADLEAALPLWAAKFFGAGGIAKLAEDGYMGFAKAVEYKLAHTGANRVLDRPAMDWLWARTVAKLCHKREMEGMIALDPKEINVLFLEREYGNGVGNYWQTKASKSKTIFVKILSPIVGHNGLFESMDDLWDAYSIPDEVRAVLETKKEKGGNYWVIPEVGADSQAKRPFVQPTFLTLVMRPAAARPTSAVASVSTPAALPAPAPAAAPGAAPAPASAQAPAPAPTQAAPPPPPTARVVSTGLINLPIRGKRPRDDVNDSGSKDEPMRKVSKTTAVAVEEKE